MRRLAVPIFALLAGLGCDEKRSSVGAYAQKIYLVAGKTAVNVTIDGQQRVVEPNRVDEIGISAGKHRFAARSLSAGTYSLELDVRERDETVVPIAPGQCFAIVDPRRKKILRRQSRAEPMPRAHVPVVATATDERRAATYITQLPCDVGELTETDLYAALSQGATWEDFILPGAAAANAKPGAPPEGGNEAESTPTAEEEGIAAARRPAIEAYLKLVDGAAGLNHVGRTEGRSPSAIWVKDGRAAIANLSTDTILPPTGKPAAARAKKIGAAVKAVLGKKPSTAPGEVLSLDNLELYAVDKETIETYQKQYQGVFRETFPVKRRDGQDALVFLYRIGPLLWVTQSMKRAFAAAGVDLLAQVGEMERAESGPVAQCVAQIAAVKAGSCSTAKTEGESGARLHRLVTAPPATPLYVQVLVDPKAGTSDLRLFEAPPAKLPREQTTIGYSLRVSLQGLTGD